MTAEIKEIHKTLQTSWVEYTDGFVIRTYVTKSSHFEKHGAEVLHPKPLLLGLIRTFKGVSFRQLHRTPSPNSGSIYGANRQAYDWLIDFVKNDPILMDMEVPVAIDPKSVPQPPPDPEAVIASLEAEFKRCCRIIRDKTQAKTRKLGALADLRAEAMEATRKVSKWHE